MAKALTTLDREQKLEDTILGWRMINPAMVTSHGIDSMAQTAENLAREFNISRADQDAFALRSQQRAGRAMTNGRFDLEITSAADLVQDEPVRADSTLQGLAALEPILGPGTSITAGNASGLNDGACVLLLASEAAAERWQLTAQARVLGMASAGVAPAPWASVQCRPSKDCSRVLIARSTSLIS